MKDKQQLSMTTNPAYRYYNIAFIPLVGAFFIGSGPIVIVFVFLLTFVLHAVIDNVLINTGLDKKIYVARGASPTSSYKVPLYLIVPLQLAITIMGVMYPYNGIEMWPTLKENEQEYLLDKIESYKALFLVPDMKAIHFELTSLGIENNDAITIIKEIES